MLDMLAVTPVAADATFAEVDCTLRTADALCCWDNGDSGRRRRRRRRRLADLGVVATIDMGQRTTGAPASIGKALSDARAALEDSDRLTGSCDGDATRTSAAGCTGATPAGVARTWVPGALETSGLAALGVGWTCCGTVAAEEVHVNATAAAAAAASAAAVAAGAGPVELRTTVDKKSDDGERDVNYWLAVGFGVAFGVISVGFCGYVASGGAFGYKRGVGVPPQSPKSVVPRGVVPSPTPADGDSLAYDRAAGGGGGGGDPALGLGGTVGLAIEQERSTCEGWLEQRTKLKDGVRYAKHYYVLYPKQMQLRYYKDVVKTSEAESANLHIGEEGTLFLGAMIDVGKGRSRKGSAEEDGRATKGRRIGLKFHYIPRSVTRRGKGGSGHKRRTRRVEFVAPTKDDANRWIRALRKFQAKYGHIASQPFDTANYRPHSTGRGLRGRPRTMGDTMGTPRRGGGGGGGGDDSMSDSGDELPLPGGALSTSKKRSRSSRRSSRKGRTAPLPPLRVGGRTSAFGRSAPLPPPSEWNALETQIGSPRYR